MAYHERMFTCVYDVFFKVAAQSDFVILTRMDSVYYFCINWLDENKVFLFILIFANESISNILKNVRFIYKQ